MACDYVRQNPIWRSWVPSACLRGQGIYDTVDGAYPSSRNSTANPLSCRSCLPGSFSSPLQDAEGLTAVCLPCAEGEVQASVGSQECNKCPLGTFNPDQGGLQELKRSYPRSCSL